MIRFMDIELVKVVYGPDAPCLIEAIKRERGAGAKAPKPQNTSAGRVKAEWRAKVKARVAALSKP